MSAPAFDGATLQPELDFSRLRRLLDDVRDLMADGRWRTLDEIRQAIGHGSEGGISARLRDLRKTKHGGHTVEKRRRGEPRAGLYEYRLIIRPLNPEEDHLRDEKAQATPSDPSPAVRRSGLQREVSAPRSEERLPQREVRDP